MFKTNIYKHNFKILNKIFMINLKRIKKIRIIIILPKIKKKRGKKKRRKK